MHSPTIFLTKAKSTKEAKDNVRYYLDDVSDRVCDWFVIGGRWSGYLDEDAQDYSDKARELIKENKQKHKEFVSRTDVEKNSEELDELWKEKFGKENTAPFFRDQYEQDGYEDDAKPLSDCLEVVRKYKEKEEERKVRQFNQAIEYLEKEEEGMAGHMFSSCGDLMAGYLCFDTMVYNIHWQSASIPEEDIEDYFAVIIDKHN